MKKNSLYLGIAACTMALPFGIQAQEQLIEELVITGSYIKRGKFESPSPTEIITAEQIKQQGAPSMAQVVRDMSISQNTDTVANVLGTQDGGQDSATARFNLRGLGTSSTLTLFDGRRSVTPNVQALVPDIAIEQVQIVLDGGATAYGSDAVAGVVNFIPIKEYDGFKVSTYYNQDDGGDYSEPKIAILGGKSFSNGLNWVGAIDFHKRSPLLRHQRPTYLAYDDDDSVFGQPGAYERVDNTGFFLDPDCGVTDPDPTIVDDTNQGAFPSGKPQGGCRFEFGEFQDYNREVEEILAYTNLSFEVNDSLTLEFQANWTQRESTSSATPSTGNSVSNELLSILTSHPDNTIGEDIRPKSIYYRPFGKYGTLPSALEGGASRGVTDTMVQRYKFGGSYTFGDTSWGGETWLSHQNSNTDTTANTIVQSRLANALLGFGGADCDPLTGTAGSGVCEYFNPFYSSHAGDTIPGTVNSQQLVDYIYVQETYESSNTDFSYLDTFVTGEVFDLPAGTVMMAAGFQYRDTHTKTNPTPINLSGDSYGSPAQSFRTDLSSEVNALFAEFDVPITDQLSATLAIRREEFKDFDLSTTVPKISVRYEPIADLAFRASYGEGFVAPDLGDRGPRQFGASCVEVFTATQDPFKDIAADDDDLQGATSCFSANPMLSAEESVLKNVGVSWKPLDGLEISADFQIIEFENRIVSLGSADLVNNDFAAYRRAIEDGHFTSIGDPLTMSVEEIANLDLANWLASGLADPLVERDATNNNEVTQVTRIPINATANEISVWDLAARYNFDTDFGFFTASMRASAFHRYSFQGSTDVPFSDGVGDQNADTALAPPIPRWKGNLRLSWLNNNHSASIGTKYTSHVDFDDSAVDANPLKNRIGDPIERELVPTRISSHTTIDVRYSYLFEELLGGDMQVTVGSNNVTDSNPDPLPIAGGLETRLYDPFGRTVYMELTYEPSF